jgi:hypothetical protein
MSHALTPHGCGKTRVTTHRNDKLGLNSPPSCDFLPPFHRVPRHRWLASRTGRYARPTSLGLDVIYAQAIQSRVPNSQFSSFLGSGGQREHIDNQNDRLPSVVKQKEQLDKAQLRTGGADWLTDRTGCGWCCYNTGRAQPLSLYGGITIMSCLTWHQAQWLPGGV